MSKSGAHAYAIVMLRLKKTKKTIVGTYIIYRVRGKKTNKKDRLNHTAAHNRLNIYLYNMLYYLHTGVHCTSAVQVQCGARLYPYIMRIIMMI